MKLELKSCLKCGKETSNPKYCSKSCSASHTNSLQAKRKKTKKCKDCNTLIKASSTYCKECKPKFIPPDYLLKDAIYDKHHKSSAFALVRWKAREVAKVLGFKSCANCGYDKHIEICHIKPISSFPEDTKLSEINHPNNLISLCPNCHWEFDHNKLELSTIQDSNLKPTH